MRAQALLVHGLHIMHRKRISHPLGSCTIYSMMGVWWLVCAALVLVFVALIVMPHCMQAILIALTMCCSSCLDSETSIRPSACKASWIQGCSCQSVVLLCEEQLLLFQFSIPLPPLSFAVAIPHRLVNEVSKDHW